MSAAISIVFLTGDTRLDFLDDGGGGGMAMVSTSSRDTGRDDGAEERVDDEEPGRALTGEKGFSAFRGVQTS